MSTKPETQDEAKPPIDGATLAFILGARRKIAPADDCHLSSADMRKRLNCSQMTLWRRVNEDPDFPKPMRIGNRLYWLLSEIVAWETAHVEMARMRTALDEARERRLAQGRERQRRRRDRQRARAAASA